MVAIKNIESANGQIADNWLPSKYNSFTIKSQQFQNKNQSSIIVSSSFVMFLTFAPFVMLFYIIIEL